MPKTRAYTKHKSTNRPIKNRDLVQLLPLLDELIRLNRDFAAVASFDELLLGPLHRNPHVQRGAQRLSDATEAAG